MHRVTAETKVEGNQHQCEHYYVMILLRKCTISPYGNCGNDQSEILCSHQCTQLYHCYHCYHDHFYHWQ